MERTVGYIRACPSYGEPDYRCRIKVYAHEGLARWRTTNKEADRGGLRDLRG